MALLTAKLIDEIQICYFPVILGEGISLFPNNTKGSTWKYIGSTTYKSGVVKVDFMIDKTY